jgi:uncharacterized protein YPO0396
MGLFNKKKKESVKLEDVLFKIENDLIDVLNKHQRFKERIQVEKIAAQLKDGQNKLNPDKLSKLNQMISQIIDNLQISKGQSSQEDIEYLQDIADGLIADIDLTSVQAQYEGNRNIEKLLTSKSKDIQAIQKLIIKQTQKKSEYELMLKGLKDDVIKAQSKLKKNPIELNNLWRTIQRLENDKTKCDIQIGKLQEALNASEGRYNILEDYESIKVADAATKYNKDELERIKQASDSILEDMTKNAEHIDTIEGINDPQKILATTADVSNELDLWLAQQSESDEEESQEEVSKEKKEPVEIKQ